MTSLATREMMMTPAPQDRERRDDTALLALAVVWPAVAGVLAFFMLDRRMARIVLACVLVLISYRIVLVDPRLDAYELGDYARELATLRLPDFPQWVTLNCFHTEKCIDPVQPFFTFFLTRFSGDPSFAFAGYAAVFAAFSIAMLAAVRQDIGQKVTWFSLFFLFAIMATNPITNIGGFRFNTASWVFLFGSYLVFLRGRDAGFAFILLAVALHYSMAVLLGLAIVLRIVRVPLRTALILALLSYIVSSSVEWLLPLLNLDFELGALSRAARYLSVDALEAREMAVEIADTSNLFFLVFSHTGVKFVLALWMAYLLFSKKNRLIGDRHNNLLIFSLQLFTFANLFANIPSFSRYGVISMQLLYACFAVTAFAYTLPERRTILVLFTPAILFSLLIITRTAVALLDVYGLGPTPFLLVPREGLYDVLGEYL
jgi:hypothetical protein